MTKITIVLFVVAALSGAALGETKEFPCVSDSSTHQADQLTLDESRSTVEFERHGGNQPAEFAETTINWTWDTHDGHNLTPHVFHFELNRMTGVLQQDGVRGPTWACSVSEKKF